jgi:uncharacterized membrane protein
MQLLKFIHVLSVVIWVGGIFFAYVVLRPSIVEILEPPQRLRLWNAVFRRFFTWVWVIIAALLASGLYLIQMFGGMAYVAPHIHIMLALGLAMMAIFGYLYFACYKPLSIHVENQRWQEAGAMLAKIRKLVAVNLALGLITIAVVELMR